MREEEKNKPLPVPEPRPQNGESISRRDFLKLFGKAMVFVPFMRLTKYLPKVPEGEVSLDFPLRLVQETLPPETQLFDSGENLERVSHEVLKKMNGGPDEWGKYQNTQVIWTPLGREGSRVGDKVRQKLRSRLFARAAGEWNSKDDSGWRPEDREEIQSMLNLAVERAVGFFGQDPLFMAGFLPVNRPSKKERARLSKEIGGDQMATAAFGMLEGGFCIMDISNQLENGLEAMQEYQRGLFLANLTHEFSHGLTGSAEILPFELHPAVYLAGVSHGLIEVLNKPRNRKERYAAYHNLEALVWLIVKKKSGLEFYAELFQGLIKKYGASTYFFTKEQVVEVTEKIFVKAKVPFSFDKLRKSMDKEPGEEDALRLPMTAEYHYPSEVVKNDPDNPEGIVSWWLPVLWPVPIDRTKTKRLWSNDESSPFPLDNGYYLNYLFIGNGKLEDGPIGGNRSTIALWKKGGKAVTMQNPKKGWDTWYTIEDSETTWITSRKKGV